MKIENLVCALSLLAVLFYAAVRLRFELQMMQQNSYKPARYGRWLRGGLWSVSRITDAMLLVVAGGFIGSRWAIYALGGVALLALYKAVRELRTKYKKPLVFTARAIRIYVVGLAISAAGMFAAWWLCGISWLVFAAMSLAVFAPVVACLSLVLLMPVEFFVNKYYYNDARRILRSMPRLKVIGITGSYGKTSTKHYLYRILSERFNTVMTPGSFNTTLGVVRTIRENLKPYTEVFIVEMGAKSRGDIAEICRLVHPTIGIITAVGEQHLESFKTIENVQKTKFELVDALPANGVAILNDENEFIANRPVENVKNVLRYTSQDVNPAPFETRLLGRYNLSNLYAAWLAGKALGMTDEQMRYAVSQIEPVEHRLSIKQLPGGLRIIDDAFNSNPHGAQMALEVLAGFPKKRIIVTPGMIELGAKQAESNREFGRRMASSCDFAIVVGEYNREVILAGLADEKFPENNIYAAKNFADATAKVREIARAGDTILYENDLPDTFK